MAERTRTWIRARPLAHAAEQRHHQIVSLGPRIDSSAALRHPQSDTVMREDREGERELRPVERASGFADHDAIEATVTTSHIGKQP